jgi:hypothetical protein
VSHYSVKRNFIFIHVPKTGGVAVLKYLNPVKDLVKVQDLRDAAGVPRSGWDDNHYSYKTTMESIPDIEWNPIVFGVVRNPFDRMVSMFTHRQRKKKYNTPEDQKVVDKGFEYWLLNTKHRADKMITTVPQMSWFDECDNPQIIKNEELNTNWLKDVTSTTDFKHGLERVHKSQVDHSKYSKYHTKNTIEHIEHYFARDIEWGNYGLG